MQNEPQQRCETRGGQKHQERKKGGKIRKEDGEKREESNGRWERSWDPTSPLHGKELSREQGGVRTRKKKERHRKMTL